MVAPLVKLQPALRAAGFWSAICLPWIALAFVVTGAATTRPVWFSVIVLAAGIGAVAGKNYTLE